MSTPAHIVLEWYFLLPVYAIFRSILNELGSVAAIGLVFVSGSIFH
jgi:quinol-cytochrome oxidoreductase complex cytochrome b subunit